MDKTHIHTLLIKPGNKIIHKPEEDQPFKTGYNLRMSNRRILFSKKQNAPEDNEIIKQKIETLRIEHRDLDEIIHRLATEASVDQLQIRRLKKRKLCLKDQITKLESKLIPDLNA